MKKGLYPGTWDTLHPGHLFALDWASKHCDHLTVALNIDPTVDNPKKEKPLESDLDRFIRLLSCKFVDSIVYYEGERELEILYRSGYYDIAFISVASEKSYTPTYKVTPVFVPRLSEHSSTGLRRDISKVSGLETPPTLEFHAERQHQIWAHWMEHQFGMCQEQPDGSLIIPAEKVARWKRQLATPYDELSETERESDRQVVREHLSEVL